MQIYSVSEIVSHISAYLEQGLGSVAVQGEVTGYNINQNRLIFFELKDDNSRVTCFALTHQITEALEDGMEIKILGLPKLFKKSGKFHLHVQEVELVGAGALQKAFEKLKAKLSSEGLFDEEHKQTLPRFPQSIGLITSRDAAAYNDVMIRLNERWGGLDIKFAHTGVQGLGAVGQLVKAIEYFNAHEPVDVLLMTRGGGSLEDLQAFNDEKLARAVFVSKIPMVVGVGHERDVTLAELVADKRASTPTNAAELVVPHRREISQQVIQLQNTIYTLLQGELSQKKLVVSHLMSRVESWLDTIMSGHNQLKANLLDKADVWLNSINERLAQYNRLLNTLSPQATLKRGYSITLKNGKAIKQLSEVKPGDQIQTKLVQGDINSEVL